MCSLLLLLLLRLLLLPFLILENEAPTFATRFISLYIWLIELFFTDIGLFCGDVGFFCGNIGLFCGDMTVGVFATVHTIHQTIP